jgi:hypothetical protein
MVWAKGEYRQEKIQHKGEKNGGKEEKHKQEDGRRNGEGEVTIPRFSLDFHLFPSVQVWRGTGMERAQ